jgi:hypothetical protein
MDYPPSAGMALYPRECEAMHKFAEEENVSEIADAIFESYRLVGRINNTDGLLLPSKGVIGAICESFLELLFPGVYGNEPIYSPHLRNVTAHRLRGIATKLVIELRKISKLAPHFASHSATSDWKAASGLHWLSTTLTRRLIRSSKCFTACREASASSHK